MHPRPADADPFARRRHLTRPKAAERIFKDIEGSPRRQGDGEGGWRVWERPSCPPKPASKKVRPRNPDRAVFAEEADVAGPILTGSAPRPHGKAGKPRTAGKRPSQSDVRKVKARATPCASRP